MKMEDLLKVYKFFKRPDDDVAREGLTKEELFPLYAFTSSKEYAKAFRKQRNMDLFIENVYELTQQEYVKFTNANRGNALEVYNYSYLKSYPEKRGDAPIYGSAPVLSTWFERESSEDMTCSSELEAFNFVCSVNPFIFPKKYKKVLYDLEIIRFWKMFVPGGLMDEVMCHVSDEDYEMLQDYSSPDVAYDNLSIFIELYGNTFNIPI